MSIRLMRSAVALALLLPLAGCFAIPVQEMTLKSDSGSTITCKQVGKGLISSSVGKADYDDCIAKAHAAGYK